MSKKLEMSKEYMFPGDKQDGLSQLQRSDGVHPLEKKEIQRITAFPEQFNMRLVYV